MTEYDPEDPKGWVVRSEWIRTGKARPMVSWWKGPSSGFGTTYSSLHLDRSRFPTTLEAALFPTRKSAEDAVRSVYGRLTKGTTAQRLADAITEEASR